jgi:acetoin utilization deacetylase AcuC-like enzyme
LRLYVHHPSSLEHETGAHPENPRRIAAIAEALSARDWLGLERVEAPAAEREQLLRVHDGAHVDAIEEFCSRGGGMIDMDTVASTGSFDAALHAAGGAIAATDRLLDAGSGFALCTLRPPGHHAERGRSMGFCLFNNVAVAAAHAIEARGAERALVFDWDVHHGNGTEAIFYEDPRVLYASIHQDPLYPGTGAVRDRGAGAGEGFTLNLPVPPGSGGEAFLSLARHVAAPVAREYRPGIVFVSAGYDAHRDDPLAQCELETGDYGALAATVRELATELAVPIVVCLEGGYALGALADSVVATVEGLGGDEPAPQVSADAASALRAHHADRWPVLATPSAGP